MNDLDQQLARFYGVNPVPVAVSADTRPSPLAPWESALDVFVHLARADRYEANRFVYPNRTFSYAAQEAFNENPLVVARFHRVVNQLWRPWRHDRLDMSATRPLPEELDQRVEHVRALAELALRPNYAAHLALERRPNAVRECFLGAEHPEPSRVP